YLTTSQYAEVRKRIMKKFSVKHDFLFISLNDGHPFSKTSWTTYINSWGRELGIVGKVSPHLWRHARFTNWMIERILTSQEINSKDDFKKNILHTQQFKKELQQYSGHKLISSLDNYLNLAWEQLHGYKEVYSAASLKTAVDTMQEQMDYLEQRIDRKELSVVQALQDMKSAMFAFKKDVAASVSNTKED
ncbi:site-specific integrase, partial [Vibrio lentus]